MAEYLIKDTTLQNIGDAIRAKTGTTNKILPTEMPEKISNISGETKYAETANEYGTTVTIGG